MTPVKNEVGEKGRRPSDTFRAFERRHRRQHAALYRRKPGPGLFRVVPPTTLLVLSADDFEAVLASNESLNSLLEPFRPKAG